MGSHPQVRCSWTTDHLHRGLAVPSPRMPAAVPASGPRADVLDNTCSAHYKPLWALGLLTAVLTAYYMSAAADGLAFFGGRPPLGRGGRPINVDTDMPDAKHAHGHESPWVPCVTAASWSFSRWILAFFGGLRSTCSPCPYSHDSLSRVGSPPCLSGPASTTTTCSSAVRVWPLALTDFIGGGHRPDPRSVPVAERGAGRQAATRAAVPPAGPGTWDELLRHSSSAARRQKPGLVLRLRWWTPCIIDGAVNGTANLVRRSGPARPSGASCSPGTCATTPSASGMGLGTVTHAVFRGQPDVVELMNSTSHFPFLTVLILLTGGGGRSR